MTVYVDALSNWGWVMYGREVKSCHMFTDAVDLEEMHQFAVRIGLRRAWFQPHRLAPHYDLTESLRLAAVQFGAVEVGRQDSSRIWRERQILVAQTVPGIVVPKA